MKKQLQIMAIAVFISSVLFNALLFHALSVQKKHSFKYAKYCIGYQIESYWYALSVAEGNILVMESFLNDLGITEDRIDSKQLLSYITTIRKAQDYIKEDLRERIRAIPCDNSGESVKRLREIEKEIEEFKNKIEPFLFKE